MYQKYVLNGTTEKGGNFFFIFHALLFASRVMYAKFLQARLKTVALYKG